MSAVEEQQRAYARDHAAPDLVRQLEEQAAHRLREATELQAQAARIRAEARVL